MKYKILNYIISLSFLLTSTFSVHAQQSFSNRQSGNMDQQNTEKKVKKEGPRIVMPLYNGFFVGADIYGIGSNILGSDFLSYEVEGILNLKNRYMPTVEIGYGKTDTWNENGYHYKTNAPYVRFGIDYNMRWKKLDYDDVLFLGLRYGYSNFKYDVESASINDKVYGGIIGNPNFEDPIWKGTIPYRHNGMSGSMHWYELVGGIRTKIFKNFFMGWSLRLRYKLKDKMDETAQPWYVPGFGKYGAKATGITYTLIYKFDLGVKQKPYIMAPIVKEAAKTIHKKGDLQRRGTPYNKK